jgi:hypothetical protein
MEDIRIFRMKGSNAKELKGSSVELEISLQTFIPKTAIFPPTPYSSP